VNKWLAHDHNTTVIHFTQYASLKHATKHMKKHLTELNN
jgi:hypothetical protein